METKSSPVFVQPVHDHNKRPASPNKDKSSIISTVATEQAFRLWFEKKVNKIPVTADDAVLTWA
jgi:uncharacterized membrane protein YbaN (DUF454 family)